MGTLDLYLVSSGDATLLYTFNTSGSASSGSWEARLYEGSSDGIYVYRLSQSLMVSRDGGGTFSNIIPSWASVVTAVAKTETESMVSSSGSQYTTMFNGSSGSYSPTPENSNSWIGLSNPPAIGFGPNDAIFSKEYTGDLIVGAGKSSTATNSGNYAIRYPVVVPFSTRNTSDTGISGTDLFITDLDSA